LGGIGKTQLAIEYAYRYVENYSLVWWIRAEEPTKLATEYSALAHYINLPEKNDIDQNKIIEGVRHWLEQNEKWLLIFDNAPNHTELRKYLPQRCNGHILITSRNPNWRGMASSLPLDVLERGESVDFLLKRTGKKDKISSKALAESLGDLPLALEQAGAYIEVTGISIADYLKFFQSYRKELLRRGKPSADYPDSVATTWEISFQKVHEASPAGAALLNLCAYFAPDDIPLELLFEEKNLLPESLAKGAEKPVSFNDALAAPRSYSLIEVEGKMLSIHRLVQAMARDRMTETERKTFAEAAIKIVNKSFPFASNDVNTWPKCSILLPHAIVVADHSERLKVASESTARLLNQTGIYLKGRFELPEARTHFERALKIFQQFLGKEHNYTITVRNNLVSLNSR